MTWFTVFEFIRRYWVHCLAVLIGTTVLVSVGVAWNLYKTTIILDHKIETLIAERNEAIARWAECNGMLNAQAAEIEVWKAQAMAYRKELEHLRKRPPVIRYRDRVRTITETVTAPECETAVRQLAEAVGSGPR